MTVGADEQPVETSHPTVASSAKADTRPRLSIEVGGIPIPFLVRGKISASGRVGLFICVPIVGRSFIVVFFILNELLVWQRDTARHRFEFNRLRNGFIETSFDLSG
jgi:hypothetical protein